MSLVLIPMRARVSCCAQEFGNVAFVESHGFGAFSRQPTKIAQTVSTWLQEGYERLKDKKTRLKRRVFITEIA